MAAIYMGERLVGGYGIGRWISSGVGGVLVLLSCLGWFAIWATFKASAGGVHRLSALLSLGGAVALIIYLLGTDLVLGPAPVTRLERDGIQLRQLLAAVWPIVLICAELPLIFVQWSARSSPGALVVETLKAQASARSGAMIAALACTLFLINAIANRRDMHVDLSYLKSAEPSESSKELVMGLTEDTEAVLFYPPTSDVLPQVQSYFDGLRGLSAHFKASVVDPAMAPDAVKRYKLARDGVVVLVRKDDSQKLWTGVDLEKAKRALDRLDSDFQKAVLGLGSERKTIYFVTGHQERSAQTAKEDPRPSMRKLREFIEKNNFRTKELSAVQGLSLAVPEDASLLIWMDPASGLFQGEEESIERYLRKGGRLLLTLDPDSSAPLDGVMAFLGLSYAPSPLANDTAYVPLKRAPDDKYNLVTNTFSAHPQVDTLSRADKGILVLFPKTGALTKAAKSEQKVTFTVSSPAETWADADRDLLKGSNERPRIHHLVAAITAKAQPGPAQGGSPAGAQAKEKEPAAALADSQEMRVVVFGDTDVFSDDYIGFRIGLHGHPGNYQLLADTLKWLLVEEQVSGVSAAEEDIKIVHTRDEDVFWFYATVFAVPFIILSLGAATGWGRGRKGRRGR